VTTSEKYHILKPRRPNEILYDCTHDNPAPIEKFKTGRIALSHMGVISMSDISIASTWGFDQLLPRNISVINEKKLYSAPNQDDLFKYDSEEPNTNKLSRALRSNYVEFQSDLEVTPERTPESHEPLEYEHEFVFYCDYAHKVAVAGEFNSWNPCFEMSKNGNKWTLKHSFPIIKSEVQKYPYKFVINGSDWKINPDFP